MQNNDTFLKFKELLRFVFKNKHSDFYRLKYEKAGFNPLSDFNSLDDVKKIPLLTKKELSTTDPFKLLFVEEEKIEYISATSGTTGEPVLVFHSSPSSTFSLPDTALNFEKILFLINPVRFYQAHYYLKARSRRIARLMGDIYNIPASLRLASKLKIDAIYTSPTLAIILKDYFERYPDLKKSLKFFVLGGELVTPQKKKFLQELYPNLKIFLVYGSAEMSQSLASQCAFLAQSNDQIYYHPRLPFHFEIIDPITKKEVKSGEKGELVVTDFYRITTPIIRYETGDLASFRKNDCPCGYPGSILQILGRAEHDIVRVGGIELKRETLEKSILNLKDYLEKSFEVHIYENFVGTKPKIRIVLNLSLKKEVKETPGLKQKIENELLENWQLSPKLNLKKAVEAGLFEIPQINFIQFPLSEKSKQVLILH